MRLVLVVNPTASAVRPKVREAVRAVLSADHRVDVVETRHRDHATTLAREAADDGVDAVVVLAGDGTLNEAANGLVGRETALGPLPGGSTSVFARTVGLPNDPVKAARQLAAALARDSLRTVGLGVVNGRHFLFHTGIGYDAAVVERVERRSTWKRYAGHALFMGAAVTTWSRHYDRRNPAMAVRFPDGASVDDGYFCICLSSNPYTFFGPRRLSLAPEADGRRGLAVVTLRTLRAATLLGVIGSALGGGARLRAHPQVDVRTDLQAVTVTGRRPLPYQADGDYLGEAPELSLHHRPEALRVVTP